MLPNHAPYVIAEQFGTLETLFPGRIDLGLGRAPGTDQITLRALRRDPANANNFPRDVQELQAFLGPVQAGQRIEAVPGSGTQVPLWILGSSLFGAQLAAELGLPYGFASHFAPPSDEEARFLATSQQMSFADLLRSKPSLMQAPVDDIESYWSPQEKAQASSMLACSIVGGPQTVRRGLIDLRERTGADELMVVSDMFDPALRLRSFKLIAEAGNSLVEG